MSDEYKVTLSTSVTPELKERFQRIASDKRWSLSQTIVVFIEEYFDQWEESLGIKEKPVAEPKSKKRATGKGK
jgi:hypothetical protein